jgi:hypothetical protein
MLTLLNFPLEHLLKSIVVKELKFPNPFGIVVKLKHQLKSSVVKGLKFPNLSGIVVKLEHLLKSSVVKELKSPIPPVSLSSSNTPSN